MTLAEFYEHIGGNYDDALERLMREELVKRFALRFLSDGSYKALQDAVADENIEASFRAAHNLKGVAGNVSFARLQRAASELTEQLRPRTALADRELLRQVDDAYAEVIENLNIYSDSN